MSVRRSNMDEECLLRLCRWEGGEGQRGDRQGRCQASGGSTSVALMATVENDDDRRRRQRQRRGRQRRRQGSRLGVSEAKTTAKRQGNKDLAFSFASLFATKMTYFVKNSRKYSFFLQFNRCLRLKSDEQQARLARVFAVF